MIAVAIGAVILIGLLGLLAKFYKKVEQGKALVRTGGSKPRVSFSGMYVIPLIHRLEIMDISVKRVEIDRTGSNGLICNDNMRADIKVAFFVRVNKTNEDVLNVAQSLGCERASQTTALVELFDAKFSEALKTVGKKYNFVDLYNSRKEFKEDIIEVIGRDLNGYFLEDVAIDYLEQTPLQSLNPNNILDAEGIKKITDLTAAQMILANEIARNKEKTIKKQDIEAREAILELERQLAEKEAKQQREVLSVQAREKAETLKVQQQERLKAEGARIQTDEELAVAEENKERQVIVAQKNKERTEAIETERVEKDRALEAIERERIVELTQIEKDKALEEERKNIQDVIRERVMVERAVVEEQEKIKDTQAEAEANREKTVALTLAEKKAEEEKIRRIKEAEAEKLASEELAQQQIIEADAAFKSSQKQAQARKALAEAKAAEEATIGMSEVQVMEARALAIEKEGAAQARVVELHANAEAKAIEHKARAEATGIEAKALAEAHGLQAKAEATEKQGLAEATVMAKKFAAEAEGIEQKAESMKKLDSVGKEHEEFKLRLEKEKDVELAQIQVQKDIAVAQAHVLQEGLKSAKIDIVGGETMFFEKVVGAISQAKQIDHLVEGSNVLSDVKSAFFNGDASLFADKLKGFIRQFGLKTEDVKNLTLSALLVKLIGLADDAGTQNTLHQLLDGVRQLGLSDRTVDTLGLR